MAANDKKRYVTQEGWDILNAELENLKNVKRVEVSKRIAEAIALGDLSENSEYDDAKNEQGFVEGRIAEIEAMLKESEIVTSTAVSGRVGMGSKVRLLNLTSKKEVSYTISGSSEADPFEGRISNESPIGAALMDCAEGETINVETPGGVRSFKILSIEG